MAAEAISVGSTDFGDSELVSGVATDDDSLADICESIGLGCDIFAPLPRY